MERFGFVGLPNAGKSSLFNSLAGGGALAAPYAFATTDPNVGVAKVPDPRLDALAEMSKSRNVVPTTTQFVDIGGLVEGASQGEGLGNKFLAGIREVDAVVFVLRAFPDPDVPGPSDPLEHLRIVEIELTLADLESVESRLDRRRKALKADPRDADLVAEVAALDAALQPEATMHGVLCTTCFSSPILVVNGPIARRIGMNSGVNCLGQGNRANATIGRALQLIIRNVGGGRPGAAFVGKQPVELFGQSLVVGRFSGLLLDTEFQGLGEANDARHVQRPRAAAPLLSATGEQGL